MTGTASRVAIVVIALLSGSLWFSGASTPAQALPAAKTAASVAQPPNASASDPVFTDHALPFGNSEQGTAASCPTADDCFILGDGGEVAHTSDATSSTPNWSVEQLPATVTDSSVTGMSCPTTSFCAVIIGYGLYTSANPTIASSWIKQQTGLLVGSISCPSPTLCYAANSHLYRSTDPTDPTSWTPLQQPLGVTSVSCASTSFCEISGRHETDGSQSDPVAYAETTDPLDPTPVWDVTDLPEATNATSLSCPSMSLCVAGSLSGAVEVSTDPAGADPAWTSTELLQVGGPLTVTCTASDRCLAAGEGLVDVTDDPSSGTWATVSPYNKYSVGGYIGASCAAEGSCLWLDLSGSAYESSDPGVDAATSESVLGYSSITAVACPTPTFCVAGDDGGHLLSSTDPSATPGSWTVATESPHAITGLTCVGTAVCVATTYDISNSTHVAEVLTSHNPAAATPTWTDARIPGVSVLGAVTCRLATACLIAAPGGDVVGFDPDTNRLYPDFGQGGYAVSCASTLCLSTDGGYDGFATIYGLRGAVFAAVGSAPDTDRSPNQELDCPSDGLCLLLDGTSTLRVSTDPEDGAWTTASLPGTPSSLACSSSVRLCVAGTNEGAYVTDDPTAGTAAWSTIDYYIPPTSDVNAPIPSAGSCPGTNWCVLGDGPDLHIVTASPTTPSATTTVAVTGTNDQAYVAGGPAASTGFHFLRYSEQNLQGTTIAVESTASAPPAIAAIPSSGPWPAQTVVVQPGGNRSLYARVEEGGWFQISGGQCLGVAATTNASALEVACEGTDHQLYTASAPLPVTTQTRLSAWSPRRGVLTTQPAVATLGGRELVAVLSTGDRVWTTEPGYSGWTATPLTCTGAPAIATASAASVDLACRSGAGGLVSSTRTASSGWSAFTSLGGRIVGQPGIAIGAAGPTYAVEGTDDTLYTRTDTTNWKTDGGRLKGGASIAQTS